MFRQILPERLKSHCELLTLSIMESEKYRKFLRYQAGKRPIRKSVSTNKMILKIPGDDMAETSRGRLSDILDSILLGKEMGENITVDRRAASLLSYRLSMLEEENLQMRRKIRSLKVIIGSLAAAIASLSAYIILYLIT